MADDIKRLNYFTGQFLDAQDFRVEQAYHKEMRWRGNRVLYTAGVASGLGVAAITDGKAITVSPGVAFDDQGRELVILPPAPGATIPKRPVPSGLTGNVNVVISYAEALTDSHSVGGYTGATRVTETPNVDIRGGPVMASEIVLATLVLDANGAVSSVETPDRVRSSIIAPGRIGVGTVAPKVALDVVGVGMVSDGTSYAVPNDRMRKGSLTIGSISASFGGGTSWNTNTAGLLLETGADTEIAVHDSGTRVSSLLHYEGDTKHRLTIGRDMGWGPIPQIVVSGAAHAGNSDVYFTKVDHNHSGFGNTAGFAAIENAADFGALMILGRADSPVPGSPAASKRRVVRLWDFLEVNGDSRMNGSLSIDGDIAVRGKHAVRGNDAWLRLNQDGVFASGVHTPGLFYPGSLNVGGPNNPGPGNAAISGALSIGGDMAIQGKHALRGNDPWLRLNQDRAFSSGVHTPGLFFPGSLNVGGANDPGDGNASVAGNLSVGGDIVLGATKKIDCRGRMHIFGDEILYLLNIKGVVVSTAWQGNGQLLVEGALITRPTDTNTAKAILANHGDGTAIIGAANGVNQPRLDFYFKYRGGVYVSSLAGAQV